MMRILIRQIVFWNLLVPGAPAMAQRLAEEGDDSASVRGERSSGATRTLENRQALARDTFTYVATGRRDPFLPVASPAPAEGYGFLEPEVLGIISHPDPLRSVALVRAAPAREGEGMGETGGAAGTSRLRAGARIGNVRILAIYPRHVVFAVKGADGVERRLVRQPWPPRGAR